MARSLSVDLRQRVVDAVKSGSSPGSLGILPRAAVAQLALPEGSVRAGLDVPIHDMSGWPADWTGDEEVVMLAYPGMTALDLVAPQYMVGSLWGTTVKVVAKTLDPVVSDTRLAIVPDITFDQAHAAPGILFVPGGISGTLNAMEDRDTIDFIACGRKPQAMSRRSAPGR